MNFKKFLQELAVDVAARVLYSLLMVAVCVLGAIELFAEKVCGLIWKVNQK